MQNICHNLVNQLNDPFQRSNRAKVEDVEAVLEKTLETSGYYFDDYVWNWSSADERVGLALLAEAGEWAGSRWSKYTWAATPRSTQRAIWSRDPSWKNAPSAASWSSASKFRCRGCGWRRRNRRRGY
jgi:hypothetical protein